MNRHDNSITQWIIKLVNRICRLECLRIKEKLLKKIKRLIERSAISDIKQLNLYKFVCDFLKKYYLTLNQKRYL